jgi:hypothetical protein
MDGHGERPFGPGNPVRPGRRPSLETIALGDVVTIRGERMVYEGEIMLSEDGYHWQELRMAGSPERYLGVEYTPEPELTLWSAVEAPGVEPGPRTLDVNGRRYRREERGTARFRAVNVPGLPEHGTCDYVDYVAEDGTLMSFERFQGGAWEASSGVPVHRSEVEVTAGTRPA